MPEMRFTKDHEWVRQDGDTVVIGITDHAQNALGDVVFVDLPEVGREVVVPVQDAAAALPDIVRRLDAALLLPLRIHVHTPTLDDVFLSITGRSLREEPAR